MAYAAPMLRRGIYPALITFYDERERVDAEASAAHAARLVDAGVDGLVVCGSTGEFHLLSLDERRALLEAVAGAASGRVSLTVHVGAPTTRATCELASHAAEHGAEAVLVVTPYYNRVGADEQRAYLRAVADAAGGLPVLAYTMPKMAGDRYPVELLAELARDGVVHGVKESGDELARLLSILEAAPEGFAAFAGSAPLCAPCLLAGGHGGVLALANVAPEACVAIAAAIERGDGAQAMLLTRALAPLQREISAAGSSPAGYRAGASLRDPRAVHVRAPLFAAPDAARERIARALDAVRPVVA
jgi:dihydrodipicolinate synthase/N-acetylneuraminate lyase